ncbi:MAG: nucleotide exchange factor GrpE [Vicinamibacterales bacterium]
MSTKHENDAAAHDAAPDATATTSADPSPETGAETGDPTEALQREKNALQDRLLRTAAEFDNYRKRMERERADFVAFAAADILGELLPIVDSFERALQAPAPPEAEAFRTGAELIHRQMLDLLRKRGVKPIETLGADFDPNLHQAVIYEDSPEHRDGEVIAELQKGYLLGDRLLRPAMVKVAKA